MSYAIEKLWGSSVKCQMFHRGKTEPSTPGSIMASTWKKPVTDLYFNTPLCGKLTVNVNVVDMMDDSCFHVCHAEPVCNI